jgi:hypothetical protein
MPPEAKKAENTAIRQRERIRFLRESGKMGPKNFTPQKSGLGLKANPLRKNSESRRSRALNHWKLNLARAGTSFCGKSGGKTTLPFMTDPIPASH